MCHYRFLAISFLLANGIASTGFGEEGTRHFSARQVFDYESPILFESNFAKSGFDKWNISEDGRYRLPKSNPARLEIADAPALDGSLKAVRFRVPKAPNSYRSEISLPSEKGFNERWYGISLFVPDDWTYDPNKGADIVIQWHAVPGNWKPTYPNLVIAIQDSSWFIRQSFGSPQKGPVRKSARLKAPVAPGCWVSWIICAKWSPDADGRIRVWRDGESVFDVEGPNAYGTIGKDYTPYLKTGIYHPEWNLKSDSHKKRFEEEIAGVTEKEIYVSKVIVGSGKATYEGVFQLLPSRSKHDSE